MHAVPPVLDLRHEKLPALKITECVQDFNREVLTALTIPTVAANVSRLPASQKRPVARFMAGSWAAMPAWLRSTGLANSFDIILTAETIYNSASSMDLYQTLTQVRQWPAGAQLRQTCRPFQ